MLVFGLFKRFPLVRIDPSFAQFGTRLVPARSAETAASRHLRADFRAQRRL
jgi:hypothetical protein